MSDYRAQADADRDEQDVQAEINSLARALAKAQGDLAEARADLEYRAASRRILKDRVSELEAEIERLKAASPPTPDLAALAGRLIKALDEMRGPTSIGVRSAKVELRKALAADAIERPAVVGERERLLRLQLGNTEAALKSYVDEAQSLRLKLVVALREAASLPDLAARLECLAEALDGRGTDLDIDAAALMRLAARALERPAVRPAVGEEERERMGQVLMVATGFCPTDWDGLPEGRKEFFRQAADAVVAAAVPARPAAMPTKARMACLRDEKVHIFTTDAAAREWLVANGNDWSFAGWVEGIEWHPAGTPEAAIVPPGPAALSAAIEFDGMVIYMSGGRLAHIFEDATEGQKFIENSAESCASYKWSAIWHPAGAGTAATTALSAAIELLMALDEHLEHFTPASARIRPARERLREALGQQTTTGGDAGERSEP